MTNDVQKQSLTPDLAPEKISAKPDIAAKKDVISDASPKKHKRSAGEKFVDFLAYPLVNNIGVFVISVAATYLTSSGHEFGKEGSFARKTGEWFHRRGENLINVFQKLGMKDRKTANMWKMVFFSFFDGTFVAPFVKLLEDRREHVAKWFDNKFGTKPSDDFVYKVEPKQSWGSVISGRLATSLIVVPTAVLLGNVKKDAAGWYWKKEGVPSLNDILFHNPGFKKGTEIAEKPNLPGYLKKLDLPELFKTVYFEFFYTSVCTAGLYISSRFFAKQSRQHKEVMKEYKAHTANNKANTAADSVEAAPVEKQPAEPTPHISHPTHHQRLAEPTHAQEVTA